MDPKLNKLLDRIGQNILKELKADARLSYSRLGRRVGLSTPAVTERVRRLEEAGIIQGYHARISPLPVRQKVTAFMALDTPAADYGAVKRLARDLDPVLECHHVSGSTAFILKLAVDSVQDLEALVARFSPYGRTRTSIVLSSAKEAGEGRYP